MPVAGPKVTNARSDEAWWETAVVYQVYLRSFADGDGDGTGDLEGLRQRLPYLASLGVDALWINPWYPSPMKDGGYDVADYRDIEPAFGTLAEAENLIAEVHNRGMKIVLDIVPNHTSSQHHWFQAALAGDEAARARYLFRPGRGPDGDLTPNDWRSVFGGPAWTRVAASDGKPAEWYLHLFASGQPDLNWSNHEVIDEFENVLRFWFDRGVDGFRIDVAHGLSKAEGLPDAGLRAVDASPQTQPHPAWDQEEVHEIYRGWRKIADSYDPPTIFVAEVWVPSNERVAQYLRPDELHTAFQFDFLRAPWRAASMRNVIDDAMSAVHSVGATSTWVLSNHDVVRHVTRYARSQPDRLVDSVPARMSWSSEKPDLERGVQRARAAILLTLALPGTAYVYQGEELGLEEVEDLPAELRQDPIWEQSGHTDPGRDGCRVPLPWCGDEPPFGFSPDTAAAAPWLPQPAAWKALTAKAQEDQPDSMLALYRDALALRKQHLRELSPIRWLDVPEGVLAFRRGPIECWVNTGSSETPLPCGRVMLCSMPGYTNGVLPADTTVWLHVA